MAWLKRKCARPGCQKQISGSRYVCSGHWKELPVHIQRELQAAFVAWECGEEGGLKRLKDAQIAASACFYVKQNDSDMVTRAIAGATSPLTWDRLPGICYCGGAFRSNPLPNWMNRWTCEMCGQHMSR